MVSTLQIFTILLKRMCVFFFGGVHFVSLFPFIFGGMCEVFCRLFITSGIFVFIPVKQT
jgi:hypothetical protein